MAFGQQPGPPASARQMKELLSLLQDAGHADFRAGRGPMGFTQRQGGGKFTHDEAAVYIERLQEAASDAGAPAVAGPVARLSATEQGLRRMPTEAIAAELQRRGWIVIEP